LDVKEPFRVIRRKAWGIRRPEAAKVPSLRWRDPSGAVTTSATPWGVVRNLVGALGERVRRRRSERLARAQRIYTLRSLERRSTKRLKSIRRKGVHRHRLLA